MVYKGYTIKPTTFGWVVFGKGLFREFAEESDAYEYIDNETMEE